LPCASDEPADPAGSDFEPQPVLAPVEIATIEQATKRIIICFGEQVI
jgi:hypothetical protein